MPERFLLNLKEEEAHVLAHYLRGDINHDDGSKDLLALRSIYQKLTGSPVPEEEWGDVAEKRRWEADKLRDLT